MHFSEAKKVLDRFGIISRPKWWKNGEYECILFFQVPTQIPISIVSKMTSLPPGIKSILEQRGLNFEYKNQLASLDNNNVIQSYLLTVEDFNADDWFEVNKGIRYGDLILPVTGQEFKLE